MYRFYKLVVKSKFAQDFRLAQIVCNKIVVSTF